MPEKQLPPSEMKYEWDAFIYHVTGNFCMNSDDWSYDGYERVELHPEFDEGGKGIANCMCSHKITVFNYVMYKPTAYVYALGSDCVCKEETFIGQSLKKRVDCIICGADITHSRKTKLVKEGICNAKCRNRAKLIVDNENIVRAKIHEYETQYFRRILNDSRKSIEEHLHPICAYSSESEEEYVCSSEEELPVKCVVSKIYIDIPYYHREEARQIGCIWDKLQKKWYYRDNNTPRNIDDIIMKPQKIPYSSKDRAKDLGARWNASEKVWYASDMMMLNIK